MNQPAANHESTEKLRRRLLVGLLFSAIALAGLAAWFMAWNIARPYPLAARENADIFVVQQLLRGQNPYGWESHPIYVYIYGIVYALIVYPFAAIFGPTPPLHRAITDIAIVLYGVVFFRGLRFSRVPTALAAVGTLLLFSQIALNDCAATPNGPALLFMMLSVVVPYVRDFKWSGILAGLFFALLAFYTKPYFAVGAPVLVSYLFLFRSKSKGLIAALVFAALMIASAAEINSVLPFYFTDIFYINYNLAGNSVRHLFHVGYLYLPLGISLVALLAWRLKAAPAPEEFAGLRAPHCDFLHLEKPFLLQPSLHWVTYALLACGCIYVFKMGLHGGNFLGYVFHLITPFLIWRCCIVAGVELPQRIEPLVFLQAAVILVAGFYVIPNQIRDQHDHTADWRHAADLIARHRNVLAVGELSGILQDQKKFVYDTGQTEDYPASFAHNPSPLMPAYRIRCRNFQNDLEHKVRNREFDLVITFSNGTPSPPISIDLLKKYYYRFESFPLRMSLESYQMDAWEPILVP